MTFLQPLLLAALPLIGLPILIHLINQRRYQTMPWAAMMFLLKANRMARGYARLRQWLILAMRCLAIAGLVLAISRPLTSGWLGLAGGRPDTTLILLDRSPSMQLRGGDSVTSKLETGRQQLARALQKLGSARWVLIESAHVEPREIASPAALLELPTTTPVSTQADLPALLEAAHAYIEANQAGRTEIWICSDLRASDWDAESGRWKLIRDRFLELKQGVRFNLLAYPQPADGNLAVRVTRVEWRRSLDTADLLVSLEVRRDGPSDQPQTVPVQLEIDGARSELAVELTGTQAELTDYRIALEPSQLRGWGRVSLPADANPADNEFYFAFDDPPPRRAVVVADDPQAARPLELAAAIAPSPAVQCTAETVSADQLAAVPWEQVALLLWQAPLPRGAEAELVQSFVQRGGHVIFLPPRNPTADAIYGAHWSDWERPAEELAVDTWRGDQDLLANTISGAALPVGQLKIRSYCRLSGEFTVLARLVGGVPLLTRVTTEQGGVYFCATTPSVRDSTLAVEGIVLYVATQRALAAGAAALGNTRQLIAGLPDLAASPAWERLAGAEEALSTEYSHHRGVYTAGPRLLAVNRAASEDQTAVLDPPQVAALFAGLDFVRVDDQAGNLSELIHEVWRLFLVAMMLALVVEALLCLPRIRPESSTDEAWRSWSDRGQVGTRGAGERELQRTAP